MIKKRHWPLYLIAGALIALVQAVLIAIRLLTVTRTRSYISTVSPASYNRAAGLAIICPITNKSKDDPFEVAIPDGLKVTGVILADQARNLDWRARNASPITMLPLQITNKVLGKLHTLL